MSSVGRRMTSLIFGSSNQFNLNKNIQVTLFLNNKIFLFHFNFKFSKNFKSVMRYNGTSDIYILVDKNLQHFKISNDLSYSVNILLVLYFVQFKLIIT